ncbi:phage tail protein [Aureibacter tunicatorum]|uniref:Phage tail-like protein n=1 Tax=Aureibacter tunicatorum TaxID=866807 RepID=A0AAE3XTZ5_9BACT|nr:phage tail protein [Aureibacter tunicatorum]MDR6241654.1 phage tail-like protein [Aureibacter tunicatorum]BDD07360.1 hypothetical protein AUTU_48430 [Aureibacter tunicatorum]
MAEDNGASQDSSMRPTPNNYFSVEISGLDGEIGFQKVDLPSMQVESHQYRAGNDPAGYDVKMPGKPSFGDLTLSKGQFKNDTTYDDLYKKISSNTFERATITIKQLDEQGSPSRTYTCKMCYPTSWQWGSFDANDSSPTMESITFSVESMELEN